MDTERPTATTGTTGTTGTTDPAATADPAATTGTHSPDSRARGVRVGTVVWGLVVAAIGVGLLATVAGARLDVELAVIVLVAAAGLALLVGSVATSRRRG